MLIRPGVRTCDLPHDKPDAQPTEPPTEYTLACPYRLLGWRWGGRTDSGHGKSRGSGDLATRFFSGGKNHIGDEEREKRSQNSRSLSEKNLERSQGRSRREIFNEEHRKAERNRARDIDREHSSFLPHIQRAGENNNIMQLLGKTEKGLGRGRRLPARVAVVALILASLRNRTAGRLRTMAASGCTHA